MKLNIPTKMMQKVLTLIDGWSRFEIYLNQWPGEEGDYQQDKYFSDVKRQVAKIGKLLKRRYGKQFTDIYPIPIGEEDLDLLCLGLAAAVVVMAFSKKGRALGGNMDILFLRLCSLPVTRESRKQARAFLRRFKSEA